ncbi:MAG: mscs mechanosensitive ion channel [Candidatus Peregrinibacteria bacterium Greene1014_49]|nr:MAG: mscs mechanosensitive ion channel [Candidatus Peregrinibacteria bacterium Greene1014_49]
MNKRFVLIGLFLATALLPGITAAQDGVTATDEAQLTSLYRSLLKAPQDPYILKRISEERSQIRAAIEKEVRLTPRPSEETPTPPGDGQVLPTAIDQQRALVTGLEERLKERRVDRDLLLAEEEKYYGETPPTDTGETDDFRLTKSHEELLAKVAIAEERIAVLESVLSLEQERLSKLTRDQWIAQFGDIIAILTYIATFIGIIVGERLIRSILAHRIMQPQKRYVATKIFTTITYMIVLIWLLTTVFSKNPNILTSLAIVGAGLAVALQDVVKDIVGWIMVLQKRLYILGDRISVGSYTGDVVDLSLFRTTLLEVHTSPTAAVQERTGRTLYMPNAAVLTNDVISFNRTSDFLKSELKFVLTLESNWEKAEKILRAILTEITGKHIEAARDQYNSRTKTLFIQHDPLGSTLYTDIVGDGIEMTLRFTIPIGMRREVGSEIVREVLKRFSLESDIGLAYRTSMVYNTEHKPPPLFRERKT